jgi:hypothetical protein
MDTVAKGNAFEDTVFEIIEKELKNDRLGLSPSQAKIFRKKGYYSKERKSNIIVDIAIEVWPPNAKNYSLLWVCECKNYGSTVPVNDVEEFKAKLDQIAGKNIKGVIASPNALQQGALDYAQSNGIGVVRILPNNQVTWTMSMMTSFDMKEKLNPREFDMALINQNHRGDNRSFYAAYGGYIFGDWYSLLSYSLKR